MLTRSSGVLMHITSLPNAFGIGSFGQSAYDFVDFLVETKQTYWQILPLTTTSYGDSPYQSFSAIAGNTHLIDFALLTQMGLLQETDYASVNFGDDPTKVDYERIFYARRPILEIAVKHFLADKKRQSEFKNFENQRDYARAYGEQIEAAKQSLESAREQSAVRYAITKSNACLTWLLSAKKRLPKDLFR